MDKETLELIAEIFEAIMLISFGFSWPVNVYKSIKNKSTKGKSLLFLCLIDFGYVIGIVGKAIRLSVTTNGWADKWWVFAIYIFNFIMVTTDLVLYFVNRHKERKEINQ